jgi:hypothetical protein
MSRKLLRFNSIDRYFFRISYEFDRNVTPDTYDHSMLKRILLFSMATAGMACASTVGISASGQFASSDIPNQFVSPNGHFSLAFTFDSAFTPAAVTSVGFDVPVVSVTYTLNGTASTITPSEVRFNTAANGGLFDITFGSGLTAAQFDFQGAQAFTGTTSTPVFAPGSFSVSGWTFSDPQNFDPQSPTMQAATIVLTPEPVTAGSLLAGLAIMTAAGLRKSRRQR